MPADHRCERLMIVRRTRVIVEERLILGTEEMSDRDMFDAAAHAASLTSDDLHAELPMWHPIEEAVTLRLMALHDVVRPRVEVLG